MRGIQARPTVSVHPLKRNQFEPIPGRILRTSKCSPSNMKLLKKKETHFLFFQQNKHLTDHISGFPASLVGGFNHPTFTDICQIGSFPHVKVKHQKKSVKLPLSTLTSHIFVNTSYCTLSNFTQPKQFHPNAAEGHSSSSLPGRRPAPDLRNHIRGKGCKSPPEPARNSRRLGT